MVPESYDFTIQASPKSAPGILEFGFLPLQIRHFRVKKKSAKKHSKFTIVIDNEIRF